MAAPDESNVAQPASVVPPKADAFADKTNPIALTVEENPEFGHAMLQHWDFQPGYINLNSGMSPSSHVAPNPGLTQIRRVRYLSPSCSDGTAATANPRRVGS